MGQVLVWIKSLEVPNLRDSNAMVDGSLVAVAVVVLTVVGCPAVVAVVVVVVVVVVVDAVVDGK